MSKSIWCQFSKPLAVLVTGILVSGCSSQEEIPLKKLDPTKDAIFETPNNYKETRKMFAKKGSAKMIYNPSGEGHPNRP